MISMPSMTWPQTEYSLVEPGGIGEADELELVELAQSGLQVPRICEVAGKFGLQVGFDELPMPARAG
jgi:hypothetical protein